MTDTLGHPMIVTGVAILGTAGVGLATWMLKQMVHIVTTLAGIEKNLEASTIRLEDHELRIRNIESQRRESASHLHG